MEERWPEHRIQFQLAQLRQQRPGGQGQRLVQRGENETNFKESFQLF